MRLLGRPRPATPGGHCRFWAQHGRAAGRGSRLRRRGSTYQPIL